MTRGIRNISVPVFTLLAAVSLFLFGAPHSHAQDAPSLLAQHGAWGAYQFEREGVQTCYILSQPSIARPDDRDHGHVFFMLSASQNRKQFEPQFVTGYPMEEDFAARLVINGKFFPLFIRGNAAWMKFPSDQPRVVLAMQTGGVMTVHSQSPKGTNTHYDFPLKGVAAALAELAPCLPEDFAQPQPLKPLE